MKVKAQIDRFIGKDNRIKAYASVILGGEYVIRDIAVMDSKNGLFARMPYQECRTVPTKTETAICSIRMWRLL